MAIPSRASSFDDLLCPQSQVARQSPQARDEALWDCIARASEFASLDPDVMARYYAGDPNPWRWHNLTVWLSASTRREIEEGARALVKSARAQIDKLLDPRAPTFFTPRKYHSLRIGANEEKLVDCAYNFSRTIDHFTYIAEMANVWDLLTVEFLWERLGLLEAAGCPPQGHPERVRILTPPRRDEWDELEGLRRRKEEAEIAEADSLCRAYAPLFARFTLDQMANYLDKKPIPERWALITSCLTPGQLRKVERLAKAKYDEQLRHLAYLDECDARRRR